jgi:hypothetical protein
MALIPVEFDEAGVPRPISPAELTVEIEKLNERLRRFTVLYKRKLLGEKEPQYRMVMRNGIPAYFYSERPIADRDVGILASLKCHSRELWVCGKELVKRLLGVAS